MSQNTNEAVEQTYREALLHRLVILDVMLYACAKALQEMLHNAVTGGRGVTGQWMRDSLEMLRELLVPVDADMSALACLHTQPPYDLMSKEDLMNKLNAAELYRDETIMALWKFMQYMEANENNWAETLNRLVELCNVTRTYRA